MLSRTRSCQAPNTGRRRAATAIGTGNVTGRGWAGRTKTTQRRRKIAIGLKSESARFQVSFFARAKIVIRLFLTWILPPITSRQASTISPRVATNILLTMFHFRAPSTEKQSHMLDLLDVNLGEASGAAAQVDPWGVPIAPPPPRPQVHHFL